MSGAHMQRAKARAQFIGFSHAKQGYDIIQLVESMGLTRFEWEDIKDDSTLSDNDIRDVDEYFTVNHY